MKRSFSESDPVVVSPPAKDARTLEEPIFAMKILFTQAEMQAISSNTEIQSQSGASLSTNGEKYPGTSLQELNVAGPSLDSVVHAVTLAITTIVQVLGEVLNGEEAGTDGESRLKMIVPTKAAASVIGKGGQNISEVRRVTGCHVHVDKASIPPQGGELSEQLVCLAGSLQGIQDGLPMVAEHVHPLTLEPWFPAWARKTNAGLAVPGLALEFSGKGRKATEKGDGKGGHKGDHFAWGGGAFDPAYAGAAHGAAPLGPPPASSGEPCLFFQKSGWCKYGDACRHVHHGSAAPPQHGGGHHGVSVPPPQHAGTMASPSLGVTGEVCQFFQKAGWCKFGDACRHAHTGGAAVGGGGKGGFGPPPSEICQFFVKAGWCKYGDTCKHSHQTFSAVPPPQQPQRVPPPQQFGGPPPSGEICQFFVKAGWCKFGNQCRHAHMQPGGGPPVHTTVAPAAQYHNPAGRLVCRFFASGDICKFGDQCRNLHAREGPVERPPPSGESCQFFVKAGWCKWGDACKHAHVGGPPRPAPTVVPPPQQLGRPPINGEAMAIAAA